MLESRKSFWAMVAALLIMAGLLYANTLQVPFYLDDIASIKENRAVQVKEFGLAGLVAAGARGFVANRPVAYASFAANHALHGLNPIGFHAVNILIHGLAAVFLLLFLDKTFRLGHQTTEPAKTLVLAFAGALLWLVHPLNTQSVTYVVQRMNSLAAMFYVLSLYCYAQGRTLEGRARQWAWLTGAGVAGLLALGTKENSATLPFFMVLYEWFFIQDLSGAWLKKHLPFLLGSLAAVVLLAFIYLGDSPFANILASYATRDFTLTERVLTEFRVVIFYVSLLLFPYPGRLSLEHDIQVSHALLAPPATLFALLAILALLGLAVYLARRDRFPAFAILWFLGNLVIESSVIGLELVFEHRTYLPAMLAVPALVILLGRRLKQPTFWAVLGVLLVVLSVWTIERNRQWRDPVEFWQDSIAKAPANPRPYNNLGLVLANLGQTEAAIAQYREALRRQPSFLEAHNNLGVALQKQGQIREAAEHLSLALQGDPGNAKIHNNLGNIYARLNELNRAGWHLEQALRIDPAYESAHNNMGNLMMLQGRVNEAIAHYRQALALNPASEDARHNLGIALRRAARGPAGS